jgi:hypothetical protein
VLLALVAVCFVPFVARLLIEGFLSIVDVLLRPGRRRAWLVLCVLALASVALFWFLRTGTALLGDGHLLVRSYTAAQNGDTTLIPASTENILHSERIAIGTALLYMWTGRLLHELTGMSWVNGWRLLNCVLGGVFVVLLLAMARSPGWSPMARLWLLILVLFSGIMLLFFGYPENYTPLLLCLLLFIASSVRAMHFRGSILWPLLTLVVALALHVQALVFLPALVYVFIWHGTSDPRPFVERRLPGLLAALMAAGVAAAWLTPLRRYLLQWISAADEQAVLDVGHSIDVVNEILLVFPAALFFVALFFLVRTHPDWRRASRPVVDRSATPASSRKRRSGRGSRRRPVASSSPAAPLSPAHPMLPAAWLQTRAEWHFFLLLTWGCLLYLCFFEAEIGVARDWDLFAMIAVGLLPLALILWNRFEARSGSIDVQAQAPVMAPAMALTLVLGMSWVLLNHSMPHTTRRFEAILGWETAKVPYGLEALAATYSDAGDNGNAVRVMQKAVELSPNKRLRALLGTYHFSNGEFEEARRILTEEVQRNPEDALLRTWLLRTLHELGDVEGQLRVLREGVAIDPDNMRFQLLLGEMLVQHGQVEEGIRHLRIGRQGDVPEAARAHADRIIRRYEESTTGRQPR